MTHREMRDEASTGEPAGQPLSRESFILVQGADAVSVAEGNTDRRDKASAGGHRAPAVIDIVRVA